MITLDGLTKVFPGTGGAEVRALDGISLNVAEGEIHGIVGRSGAGKSTLIRCLTGLEKPTSGTVRIGDTDIAALNGPQLRTARRKIGVVFQHANLLDSRTAARNIAHPLEIAGWSRAKIRERAAELITLVGLEGRENNYPSQLSGGQIQRVGIARGLAARPQVLLCDEPTSALDPGTTRQILALIKNLNRRLGITVLLITHEMSAVREICDHVTLLEDGAIVQTGTLLDVASDPFGRLAKELIPLPPAPTGVDAKIVNLDYGKSPVVNNVNDIVRFTEEHDALAEVVAASIETIQGQQIGRVQLALRNADNSPISAPGFAKFVKDCADNNIVAAEVQP